MFYLVITIKLTNQPFVPSHWYGVNFLGSKFYFIILSELPISATIVDFTMVTNASGPSPQPTECGLGTISLSTATGSNPALSFMMLHYFRSL